jgi:RNA polymerase sigma-70 factor (ECF subfamily)
MFEEPPRQMSEKELIQRCIAGDPVAQKQLYDKYSPLMFALCWRYAGDYHKACDMLQEGFIKVFNHLSTFSFQGSLGGWIRKVMINSCLDLLRKEQPFLSFHQVENSILPENHTENECIVRQSAEEIFRALQSLPPAQRIILSLYAIDGYEHAEIASILRISESASRSLVAKARQALMKKLHTFTITVL